MRKAMRERDGLKEKCNKSRNSEYWENYQLIKNKINKHYGRIVLKDNGSVIREQRKVAETLNNFFTSLGRTEQSTSGAKLNPDVSRIQQNLTPKPLLSLRKTNSAKVKEAMIKIKAKKATGRDQSVPILKIYF
ncbi:unnamed protein product [Porites lobata]|uniref:Uncharacterized protein n=1 Tax=Porites lobata TaxID=104759 RepID=A0ABN8QWG0_9CNID|nr:unnamed protein product [Porites lobata]